MQTSSEHSKIEFHFKRSKSHKVSYRCVSYIKSETSNIWRTGALFLKPFGERVEENHIYHPVKPNYTVTARTVYRGRNVCYQFSF